MGVPLIESYGMSEVGIITVNIPAKEDRLVSRMVRPF